MRNQPSSASAYSSSMAGKRQAVTPCCIKVGLKRGPWTPEEDEVLASYINRDGEGKWRTLPKRAGLSRCGKSCRLRWMNYLRPSVKRGQIAADEEDLIVRLHRLLGNRWSLIAGRIPGRTDNEIKNYWNTHLSKKLISQGIDPRTHKPLNHNPGPLPNPNLQPSKPAPAPEPVLNPNLNPNPNPSPNLNPNSYPISSTLGEAGSSRNGIILHDYHNNYLGGMNLDRDDGWRMSDGNAMMGMEINSNGGVPDCFNDDIFSSFLNSLIDEDMFLQNQNQHQQQNNCSSDNISRTIATPTTSTTLDPAISSAPGFTFGDLWEASLSSPRSPNGVVQGQSLDHLNRHL